MLFANTSIASDVDHLIEMTPGTVAKIEGRSVGGPFEILRIPTGNLELAKIFPDLEVMISRGSRKIVGVGAKRAFSSKSECEQSQSLVREALSKAFISKYEGPDSRWQFQLPDSSITAGTECSTSSPYPVLRLDVTHTETNNELLRHFE